MSRKSQNNAQVKSQKQRKPAVKPAKFTQVATAAKSLTPASFDRGVNQVNWLKKIERIEADGFAVMAQTVTPEGWTKLANKFQVKREGNYYVVYSSHRQRGFMPVATMHESGITGTNQLPQKFALVSNLTSVVIGDTEGSRVREAVSLALRRHANYEIYKLYKMHRQNAIAVAKIKGAHDTFNAKAKTRTEAGLTSGQDVIALATAEELVAI